MKIPIIRVRDGDGKIHDIPAIVGPPGPGDMVANIYDPQGKRTDIFQYVDERVAAIPAPSDVVPNTSDMEQLRADVDFLLMKMEG